MIFESERLRLRRLTSNDVDFVLAVTNDPQWLAYIGDRGINDNDKASQYISVTSDSFAKTGYGLWLVETKQSQQEPRIGLCGFIKRSFLSCPDLGYAFLPHGRGQGYATEAVNLVLERIADYGNEPRVSAICHPANHASLAVLQRTGFKRLGQLFQPSLVPHSFFIRTI